MARKSVFRQGGSAGESVSINMTPMIDCVFQLILFFILGSQLASEEIPQMMPPSPHHGVQVDEKNVSKTRIIVNVLSKEDPANRGKDEQVTPGDMAAYKIGVEKLSGPDAMTRLTRLMSDRYKAAEEAAKNAGVKNFEFHVEIRADYRVAYQYVARALMAAANANIAKANLTVSRNATAESRE